MTLAARGALSPPVGPPEAEGSLARRSRRRDAILAALLVATVTLFAWRGLLSAQLFSDDWAVLEQATNEDLATSLRKHGPGFFAPGGDIYFRPFWHWLAEGVQAVGGDEPRAWFATALALHLAVVLALFALALRWTARPWLAAAGACAFALAPAPAQAVAWPAAALNVLPCALLLLVAGAALWRWIERGEKGALAVALLSLVLSLGFREAGYQLLPLTLAGVLFVRPLGARWRGWLAGVVAVAGVVLLHFCLFNRFGAEDTLGFLLRSSLRGTGAVLREAVGIDAPRWVLLTTAGAIWGGAFWLGQPRTRFVLVWMLCALFPYVAKFAASRFQYLVHGPLWLAAVLLAADTAGRAGRHERVLRASGVALLAALACANALRLPRVLAKYAEAGVVCGTALTSLEQMDLAGKRAIAVDLVPPELENSLHTMLRLAGADTSQVLDLLLFRKPPFLLYGGELAHLDDPSTALLTWQAESSRYRMTTLEELAGGLTPLPILALRHRARIVSGPEEAVAALTAKDAESTREVWLYAEPSPPLAEREPHLAERQPPLSRIELIGSRSARIELVVESDTDGYLVLHVPGPLVGEQAVLVDGAPAPVLPADGPFHAVRLAPGRHEVLVKARAFLSE